MAAEAVEASRDWGCPRDPILLEIREGATLRWASPRMLGRLADESKWELEKLEQPRPPPSKLGPWLSEWPQ